jgi:hypothetical protein
LVHALASRPAIPLPSLLWEEVPLQQSLPVSRVNKEGLDGRLYCFHRLFWFAEAQQEMLPGKEFTFMSTHLFRKDDPDKQWKATETLHYPSEPKTKGNSWYEVTHKTNKDAAVYGKVTFDMKKLEERKEELPTRGTEECLCYVVNLRVYVTMLEGFRHELRFRVKWIRGEVIEDDVEGDTEEPMEIDGAEDVFVDVAPAFDLNAV